MHEHSLQFLKQLLSTPGPSSDEAAVARFWRGEAQHIADDVYADVHNNSYALLQGDGPRVLLAGHIDEIGIMIGYIDDEGYLYFEPVGGWDTQVLVGQRVRLMGHHGEVVGVIGRKPIHLLEQRERDDACAIKDLWVDIGAKSRDEAQERVRVGCTGVIDVLPCDVANGRIVSRSLDNRIGAFIVLEALRRLAAQRPSACVAAVATIQEETGTMAGARTATFHFEPHMALALDVTYATDTPGSDKKQYGDARLGGGAVLSRGSANSPLLYERLVEIATREQIPYTLQITPRRTGTDADSIFSMRSGVATGIISIPCRYMHTPNEMVDLADVENIIRLVVAFVRSVRTEHEFVPQ
jgi:endoglucanase